MQKKKKKSEKALRTFSFLSHSGLSHQVSMVFNQISKDYHQDHLQELLTTCAAPQPESAGIDQRTLDIDHNTGLPKGMHLAWSSILSTVQMAL